MLKRRLELVLCINYYPCEKSPNFIVGNLAYRCQYQTVSNMGKIFPYFSRNVTYHFNDIGNITCVDVDVNSYMLNLFLQLKCVT